MKPDTKTYAGGVRALTIKNAIIQLPVVVTIDGVQNSLTLDDAMKLRDGLTAAIEAVKQHESMPDGEHRVIYASTRYGMSIVPSKLPA